MSNGIIKRYGFGNNIPNGGHRVVRDAITGKYYAFENNACIGDNGAMEYFDVTPNGRYSIKRSLELEGDPLKIFDDVFIISHARNSIVKINYDGEICACCLLDDTSNSNDATYECVEIKTNGANLYGLCKSKTRDECFIIKYDHELKSRSFIRPRYISNFPIEKIKHHWSVIGNDIFTIVEPISEDDNSEQQITFFTEDDVLKVISEISNGSKKYRIESDNVVHIINENYAILVRKEDFMAIDIIKQTVVEHNRTRTKPNIAIIDNYEFIVTVGDIPAYCYIPKRYCNSTNYILL